MIRKIPIKDMNKAEWLEERSKSIGGSEIGAVLGLNPFQSAYALWLERTGKAPAFEGNLATDVGTALEAFVAERFAKVTGFGARVMNSYFLYRNDKYPHLHASPDRLIHETVGTKSAVFAGLECKTTSEWNTKKFKGIEFPVQYYAQCVQYMMVLNCYEWYLAVLVGNREFHIYRLLRGVETLTDHPDWLDGQIIVDNDDINALAEAAEDFWQKIELNIAPVPDGSKSSTDALNEQWPESFDHEIDLSFRSQEIEELLALKEKKKEIEARAAEIENIIKAEMGDSERARVGDHKISWKSSTSSSFDSKAFKAACPDLAAQYSKPSTTRRFLVK